MPRAAAIPSTLRGSMLIVGSAVGFGLMALFRGWAIDAGSENATLLFLRFLMAGTILALIMRARATPWPRGRFLAALVAMGAVGYFGEAFCYFEALRHLPSGLVAVLLYLYPGIVAILSRTLLGERLTPIKIAALLLAVVGTVLTIGPLSELNPGGTSGVALGVALGIGCALSYAAYIVAGARVTRDQDAVACSTIVCLSCCAVFGGLALARGWAPPETGLGWAGLVGLALVSTVGSVLMFLAGLKLVGPVRASTLSTLEAVTTLLVGWAILGEHLTPWQWTGAALILGAAIITARAGHAPHPPAHDQQP